jgi:hypothetical protein
MKYYLTHGYAPLYLEPRNRRTLGIKYAQYQLVNGILFRKKFDNFILRCLEKYDAYFFLSELHDGPAIGHFGGDTIAHKVLKEGVIGPLCSRILLHTKESRREKKHVFPPQLVSVD